MKSSTPSISIKAQGLSKRFNREWIFRDLNFEFQQGQCYAITGPNGSGKSTLLQILWGQVPPTFGKLFYQTVTAPIAVEEIHKHISIAAPYMDLIEEFTLSEMIEFHFKLRRCRNNVSTTDLMDILYLRESADKYIRNFSSGMKQRLKLGLAFYTDSPVIFLDEPGSHLDNVAFDWYLQQLSLLPKECLILIGSNDPNEYRSANASIFDIREFKK